MAEDYTSGLNILLGNANPTTTQPQSPEQDLQSQYDSQMNTEPSGFSQLLGSVSTMPEQNIELDRYTRGMAADQMGDQQYAGLDRLREGAAPEQQFADPAEMISSAGQRVERGLKAGWGDLVAGTGDTIDFVTALVSPGEGDLTTSVGSYLN